MTMNCSSPVAQVPLSSPGPVPALWLPLLLLQLWGYECRCKCSDRSESIKGRDGICATTEFLEFLVILGLLVDILRSEAML